MRFARTSCLLVSVALTIAAVGACASSVSGGGGGSTTTSSTTTGLPACTRPSDLTPPDDAGASWAIARVYLRCKDGPDTAYCLSNDLTTCPGPNAVPGGSYTDCVNQCSATEFAIVSGGPPILLPDGGVGERPQPNLPAGCTELQPNPSGWVTHCCPCQ